MNPYKINEPTAISFSGGRTSAYMLYKVLEANQGMPDDCYVTFANTGREMPETLDFVHECQTQWGIPITWLELGEYKQIGEWKTGSKAGMPKYKATTVVVDYETASRDGEPFKRLAQRRRYLPNVMARFCTSELKVLRIRDYLKGQGMEYGWTQFIGIRADEPRRAHKIHGKMDEGHEMYCPLFLDGIKKECVGEFWRGQQFDLQLPNNAGVTDWGNCDLCFLKGSKKKISLIQQRPDLAQWWIDMEKMMSEEVGTGAFFRNDQPSYEDMRIIATSNMAFDFGGDDETIPCFCGD